MKHKDGHWVWVHDRGRITTRASDGRPRMMFGTHMDITERKQADEARAEALQRLRKIAARVPGVVYQYRLRADGSSCFPYASDAIHEIYGVSPEEVREDGSKVFSRLHPDDLGPVGASIQVSARDLTPWTQEYRTRLEDGTVRWMLGNALPEREPDGAVLWHGFITDVTDRKQLETRLARQDRLAGMGMVAAGVAHEVNNPLAYVLYNVETLSQDLPKLAEAATRCSARWGDAGVAGSGCEILHSSAFAEAIQCASEALGGSHRIKDITKRLGTFSRVESVELAVVDLNRAVEGAADMASHEIKYRAQLVKEYGPLPPIWATEGQLTQVFLNLLINAAHALDESDTGNNRITLRTWAEGGEVFVEVADTGKGVPAENRERIFEPFFTTKPVGVASGLGLAICRNIVTELGGEISVASEVGKGARFLVRLPVRRPPTESEQARTPTFEAPKAARRGRVLAVDDEVSLTRVLARILGGEHEVVVANSGRAAREILEKDRAFDLVLCDLMMPELNGMELHAWLDRTDAALARQVVFMSGGAFLPKVAEYVARVGNPRIERPFDVALLRRLVPELIEAARRAGLGS